VEFSSGYRAMMNCELLLMIGTDFAYQQFFPKDATIAQIDIRGVQLGRRTNVDYVPVGDTKPTLQAFVAKVRATQRRAAPEIVAGATRFRPSGPKP
jgi:pyruvate dehydrogenase (quinone)